MNVTTYDQRGKLAYGEMYPLQHFEWEAMHLVSKMGYFEEVERKIDKDIPKFGVKKSEFYLARDCMRLQVWQLYVALFGSQTVTVLE